MYDNEWVLDDDLFFIDPLVPIEILIYNLPDIADGEENVPIL